MVRKGNLAVFESSNISETKEATNKVLIFYVGTVKVKYKKSCNDTL